MKRNSAPLLLLILLAGIMLVSGCTGGLDPQALAASNSMIQQFMNEHPNAKIVLTHFSAADSSRIIDQIRKDCENPYLDEKEYYKVTINDTQTSFYAVVWIDWANKTIECAYKFGGEGVVIDKPKLPRNCTAHEYAKCYKSHIYWFDSCGNMQDKKEYCQYGCSGEKCLGECKSQAEFRCYGGNVYWFDACGNKQEKKEYCSYGCENGFCKTKPAEKTCEDAGGYCIWPHGYCGDGICTEDERGQICQEICPAETAKIPSVTGNMVATASSQTCYENQPCTIAEGSSAIITTSLGNYTVKMIGASTWTQAIISVNGITKQVTVGATYLISGANVFINGIFMSDSINYTSPSSGVLLILSIQNCTDSDGGKNYYVKGITSAGADKQTDTCVNCLMPSCTTDGYCPPGRCDSVAEYYCNGAGGISKEVYDCPNGCSNGACIQQGCIKSCNYACPQDCGNKPVCGNGICEAGEPSLCETPPCPEGQACAQNLICKQGTCPQDCAPATAPSTGGGGGGSQEGQAICEKKCTAPDIRFADFWTDKEIYLTGDAIKFFAKLIDSNGDPATPEEGNKVYIFAVSPTAGSSGSSAPTNYNYSSGYYEATTPPMPTSNVESGTWIFFATAEKSESFAGSENVYVKLNPTASAALPTANPVPYEGCINRCLLRFRMAEPLKAVISPSASSASGGASASTGMIIATEITATSTKISYQCKPGYEIGKYFCKESGMCCIPIPSNTFFRNAYWKCYDGTESNQGGETSCKSSDTWRKYADEFCSGRCAPESAASSEGIKCGVNTFSVWNECTEAKCGNGICEPGEAPECSTCPSGSPTCTVACKIGTCPQDCGGTTCTDSDGGKNYYQQGTATAGGQSLTDHCNSDGTLTEKFCLGSQISAEVYQCPYGCLDGACIQSGAPSISGVSGPTSLKAGETGTWTIKASDPEQGALTYSVLWGDEVPYTTAESKAQATYTQTATFTHSYSKTGTYSPAFTVTDSQGLSAKTSISVNVGGTVCTDSDGGENIYIKGYCKFQDSNGVIYGPTYDKCSDNQYIEEQLCNSAGSCYGRNLKCPYGCSNGACIKQECQANTDCPLIALPPADYRECNGSNSCKVGGGYQCVQGKCVLNKNFYDCQICPYGCSDGACIQQACTNECSQNETRQCLGNASYQKCGNYDSDSCLEWSSALACPSGQACSGGYCVFPTIYYCTDTDGGANYNQQGIVSTASGNYSDFCSGYYLYEYYCSGTSYTYTSYYCPNGCSNGACIQQPPNILLMSDGFENYAAGQAPSSPWQTLANPGSVTGQAAHSGSKSLLLSGDPYAAQTEAVDLGSQFADILSYEAYVKIDNQGSGGFVGFLEQVANQAPEINCVYFNGYDGKLYFYSADQNHPVNVLLAPSFTLGVWNKVRVDLNYQTLKANVYLNDALVGNAVQMSPKSAVYSGSNFTLRKVGMLHFLGSGIYFDDFLVQE